MGRLVTKAEQERMLRAAVAEAGGQATAFVRCSQQGFICTGGAQLGARSGDLQGMRWSDAALAEPIPAKPVLLQLLSLGLRMGKGNKEAQMLHGGLTPGPVPHLCGVVWLALAFVCPIRLGNLPLLVMLATVSAGSGVCCAAGHAARQAEAASDFCCCGCRALQRGEGSSCWPRRPLRLPRPPTHACTR